VFEDPTAQVRMIEQMFKDVDQEWIGKEHPKKRGVKCLDSWEVLPDRGRLGQALLLMRFQDDNISNSNDDTVMDVGILEPRELPDFGAEFVFSTFLPDSDTAKEIKQHLSTGTDITSPAYMYNHVRDYEGNLINPATKNDYAVYFLDQRVGTQRRGAYYLPISGKSNLKRRRTTKGAYPGGLAGIDGIELTLRGLNSEEMEAFEKAKKEFEEGGPKVEAEPIVATPDDDDGLSDTDAIGEEDPTYSR